MPTTRRPHAHAKPSKLPAAGRRRSLWRVAVAVVVVAAVAVAVILVTRPGSGKPGPTGPATGAILASLAGGQVVAANSTGKGPHVTLHLAARTRTANSILGFDPGTKQIPARDPWWDAQARSFVASTSLTSPAPNSRLLIDGALTFFGSAGQIATPIVEANQDFDDPSVSPDGTWVAAQVTSPTPQQLHIIVARVSGCCSGARTLAGWGRPAWSPDGTRVAYQCSPGGSSPQLCVYDLRTGRTTSIGTPSIENVLNPAWSPDGRTIVATANHTDGSPGQLVIVTVATSAVAAVGEDVAYKASPQFSPSGAQVGYIGPGGIWIMNLNTGKERLLLRGSSFTSIQWVSAAATDFGS